MDRNAVRDFLALVRHGTLSAAGRELGGDASAVGCRIETLEGELGVRLFRRASTGCVPTDEARFVAGVVRDDADRLEGRASRRTGDPT